jgi:hypothetical protein
MNLLDLELSGVEAPLVFTIGGKQYEIPFDQCVEPAGSDMILGDPWFRLFVVMHDLSDLENPMMGLGKRKAEYKLAVSGSISTSKVRFLSFLGLEVDDVPIRFFAGRVIHDARMLSPVINHKSLS